MNENEEIVECGFIDTQADNYIKRVEIVKEWLENYSLPNPDNIFVESMLSKFASGKSKSSTIITLVQANTLTCYEMYNKFGLIPESLHVSSARKLAFGKLPRVPDIKKHVLESCISWYPEIEKTLPRKILKRTKEERLDDRCFDIADAIVIARAGTRKTK